MTDNSPIWVVDDDPDDLFIAHYLFSQLIPPHQVRTLQTGSELLDCLQEVTQLPKLVLLDVHMGDLSGLETLELIRANPAYQAVPIVVLTTAEWPDDRAKALGVGASGYLVKPTTVSEFSTLLRELVQQWDIN